jgi:ElaB/YqjD/DUF883 family membrane-anchored ribosome-binding protein
MNPINSAAQSADGLLQDSGPLITHALNEADDALQLGIKALRKSSEQLRQQAGHANQLALDYIRREPVKSVLMAAATGAVLVGVLSLLSRSNSNPRH